VGVLAFALAEGGIDGTSFTTNNSWWCGTSITYFFDGVLKLLSTSLAINFGAV
jgi:hypothetical protein